MNWIPLSKLCVGTPYSAEYLSLLARKGKLPAKKINDVWHSTQIYLEQYISKQKEKISIQNGDRRLLPLNQLAVATPHSAEYLSLLARKNKLPAHKIDNVWHTTQSNIDEYLKKQEALQKEYDTLDSINKPQSVEVRPEPIVSVEVKKKFRDFKKLKQVVVYALLAISVLNIGFGIYGETYLESFDQAFHKDLDNLANTHLTAASFSDSAKLFFDTVRIGFLDLKRIFLSLFFPTTPPVVIIYSTPESPPVTPSPIPTPIPPAVVGSSTITIDLTTFRNELRNELENFFLARIDSFRSPTVVYTPPATSGNQSLDSFMINQVVPTIQQIVTAQGNSDADRRSVIIEGLRNSLAQRIDTGTLNVSGNATIGGNLTVSGIIINDGMGSINPSFTLGSIPFQGATGLAEDNANLFWDDTNDRLGIGTATPGFKLDVDGIINATALYENGAPFIGSQWTTSGSNISYNLGNVGIGTTTPSTILSLGDTGANTINISTTATSTFGTGLDIRTGCFSVNGACISAGGSGSVGSGILGQFPYYAGSGTTLTATSSLFISTAGNIGIGTTGPTSKLDISGVDGTDHLRLTNTTPTTGTSWAINSENDGTLSFLRRTGSTIGRVLQITGTATLPRVVMQGNLDLTNFNTGQVPIKLKGAVGQTADLFQTQNSSSNVLFNVTAAGNVGIGTTSPYEMLSVAGTVVANNFNATSTTATSTFSGGVFVGTPASYNLQLVANNNQLSGLHLGFQNSVGGSFTANAGTGEVRIGGTNSGGSYFTTLYGNGNEQVRIQNSKVGIATTTPWAKLSVTNSGNDPSFVVEDSASPDLSPFIIDASGNVGIGTTNPLSGYKLESIGRTALTAQSEPYSLYLQYSSASLGMFIGGTSGGNLQISDESGNARLTIQSDGKIGIGTTTPGTLLSLGNTGNDTINISATATSTFGSGLNIRTGCFSVNGTCLSAGGSGTVGAGTTGQFPYYAANGTALTATSSLFVSTAGDVGIGTTNPQYKLEVNGVSSTTALNLPNTASEIVGTINFGGLRFIHNYGSDNVFVGKGAGNFSNTGDENIGIGDSALDELTSGVRNTAVGAHSLAKVDSGHDNTGLGWGALQKVTTGDHNIGIGFQAGKNLTIADNNVFIGTNSGTVATGAENVAVGINTLFGATSGNRNTAVGTSVLFGVTTGERNIGIGYATAQNLTSGSNNIIIGNSIDAPSTTADNQLNIGNLIFGTGLSGTGSVIAGNIGVGSTTPFAQLGVENVGSGLSFAVNDVANDSTPFVVDASGSVGIGTTTPGTILSLGNTGNDTINISTTATSTFGSGLNIRTGCFSVNGTCISGAGGSGAVGSGTTGQFPYYAADGTTLTATSSIFTSTAGNVGIGTALPATKLEVNGALRISGSGTDTFTTPQGANVPTKINIPLFDPGAFGQVVIFGVPGSAVASTRGLMLADARLIVHQPTIGVFSVDENDIFGLSWEGTSSKGFLKTLAGDIGFRSNTTDIMTLLAGGNVGIGTTGPSEKLHINSTDKQIIRFSNTDSFRGVAGIDNLSFYTGGTSGDFIIAAANNIRFGSSASTGEKMFINTTSGNIGIGTTTPTAKVHVSGAVTGANTLLIENTAAGTADYAQVQIANDSGSAPASGTLRAYSSGYTTSGANIANSLLLASSNAGGLTLSASNAAGVIRSYTAGSERMRIDNAGNVGIGTTNPGQKLDITSTTNVDGVRINVVADSTVRGALQLRKARGTVGSETIVTNGDPFGGIYFYGHDGANYQGGAAILGVSDGTPGTADMPGKLTFHTSPDGGVNLAERMVITSTGSVGIATTTPWKTLSVVGTMAINGLTNSTANNFLCIDSTTWEVTRTTSASCIPSSLRYKTNVNNSLVGLAALRQLRPVSFQYNEDLKIPGVRLGFIAEEVAQVDPRLVTYNAEGQPEGLDDFALISASIKAIQELDQAVQFILTGTSTPNFAGLSSLNSENLLSTFGQTASDFFSSVLTRVENSVAFVTGLVTERLVVGSSDRAIGITIFDTVTGEPRCISSENGVMVNNPGECQAITRTVLPPPTPEPVPEPIPPQTPEEVVTPTPENVEPDIISPSLEPVQAEPVVEPDTVPELPETGEIGKVNLLYVILGSIFIIILILFAFFRAFFRDFFSTNDNDEI